jgi:hypothetical protein
VPLSEAGTQQQVYFVGVDLYRIERTVNMSKQSEQIEILNIPLGYEDKAKLEKMATA